MARASRREWLLAGLTLLRDAGDQGITIDKLCASLAKTKGSFYHHFVDFDAFLTALLELWEDELTTKLIETARSEVGAARQGERLDEVVTHIDHKLDQAVRAWGRRDARVRSAVTRVDRRRMAYLEELHRQLGHARRRAELMAQLEYALFLGVQHVEGLSLADKRELREQLKKLLAAR